MNRNRRGDDTRSVNKPGENIEIYVYVSAEKDDRSLWTELSKYISNVPGEVTTMEKLPGEKGNEFNQHSMKITTNGQPNRVGDRISRILNEQVVSGKNIKIMSHIDASDSSKETVRDIITANGVDKECVTCSF